MKRIYLYILIFSYVFSKSQNLVPNYSFETYTLCPNSGGQIESATPWTAATTNGSTDYFNVCSSSGFGVPRNSPGGFQYARTGNAYGGLVFCASSAREYLQVQLSSPLIQSRNYYVEFYVNLANFIWSSPCNNIAANLSITKPYTSTVGVLQPLAPHIMNPGNPIISDTLNWVKISGCYLAQGGEEYLTIGNFFDINNTQVGATGASYYYVDDVLVEEMTGPCVTGVNELALDNTVNLLPNPANGLLSVNSAYEIGSIELSNIAGQLLLAERVHSNTYLLQVGNLAEGIYFVKITYANGLSVTKKVVKQ